MPRASERSYWPAQLVEDETPSIIFTAFDLTEHLFAGKEAGGAAGQAAAEDKEPRLLKRVKFDSEAGMFCAHSDDYDALHTIAQLLKGAARGRELNRLNPSTRRGGSSRPAGRSDLCERRAG
jgi:hypothetical protein